MTNKTLIKLLRQAGPEGVTNNPEIALEVMRKAADALEAQEWKPIEEASKDPKERVDIWTSAQERFTDCHWRNGKWVFWGTNGFESPDWEAIDGIATHFMPLPLPPEAE